jgi:hypothetical protein
MGKPSSQRGDIDPDHHAPSVDRCGWRLGVLYPGSSCYAWRTIPCNNTNPGPGTPTRVQQFDSDLIVINEVTSRSLFQLVGLKWNVPAPSYRWRECQLLLLHKCGMVIFFCYMQPTFFTLRTHSKKKTLFLWERGDLLHGPWGVSSGNSVTNMRIHVICAMMAMGKTECMAMLIRSLGQNTSVLCISYRTTLTEQCAFGSRLLPNRYEGNRLVTLNSFCTGSQLESSTW